MSDIMKGGTPWVAMIDVDGTRTVFSWTTISNKLPDALRSLREYFGDPANIDRFGFVSITTDDVSFCVRPDHINVIIVERPPQRGPGQIVRGVPMMPPSRM